MRGRQGVMFPYPVSMLRCVLPFPHPPSTHKHVWLTAWLIEPRNATFCCDVPAHPDSPPQQQLVAARGGRGA